jgi:chorismate synthase
VIDSLPAGFKVDMQALSDFMRRRSPGRSRLSTSRREPDEIEFVSGLVGDTLCGAPLCALIKNTDVRPGDYTEFYDLPRPGHADYTAAVKFGGHQDASGGGHFSGRLTAPLCVAGGICIQILAARKIYIASHIEKITNISDRRFNPVTLSVNDFMNLTHEPLTVIDPAAGERMAEAIESARADRDSVGGVVECAVIGLPAGVGSPMFEGMENKIASLVFGIPAVKGIEFGNGFDCADLRGSENNDPFIISDGLVKTKTNNHGGILGGITTGMPLIFRVAIKPTPSISKTQQTISLSGRCPKELRITGRHDPCIVPRALPAIEASAALAVYDSLLTNN